LSKVHISQGDAVVGEARIMPAFPLMPINGWSPVETAESRPLEQGQGETVVTYRRGLSAVSVGRYATRHPDSKRGKITRLSAMSKSRMVRALEDALAPFRHMATLTVGADWSRDGAWFKTALDRFLKWFMVQQRASSECPGEDAAFWFLEFQARGAPHAHIFYTSRVPWQDAAAYWADCIGDPRVARSGTKFETLARGRGRGVRAQMCGYARKYACKVEQKLVPDDYRSVGRFWGIRGCRIMVTCKVQIASVDVGGEVFLARTTGILEAARSEGLLRYVRWQEGDGGCYFTRQGASLYDIHLAGDHRSVGVLLDLTVMGFMVGA
jgi:hypothetical protein